MGTIVRGVILYWLLLFVLRVVGRRGPSQLTPFELILVFLLGGMSIQAVLGDDHSLTNSIVGVLTIALMHVIVATLKQRYPAFGKVIDGTPVVVYETGEWQSDAMKSLRLQVQDVMASARQQGIERLEQIKYAVVERNGQVSIIRDGKEA